VSASVIWAGSFLLALWWSFKTSSAHLFMLWSGLVCFGLCLAIAVAISERDSLSDRIAREIPTNPIKKRLAFFFFSGSAGGLAWVAGMSILTTFAMNLLSSSALIRHTSDLRDASFVIFSFVCYFLGYALIAGVIRRVFFSSLIDIRNTWVVFLLVSVAFCILPMFLWSFLGSDSDILMLGNPFASLSRSRYLDGLFFGLSVLLLGLILNFSWLRAQVKEFASAGASHE
jgi:hypothetical protein